jgi:hypothetical protein
MVATRFILTDSKRVVNIFLEFIKIKKEGTGIGTNVTPGNLCLSKPFLARET